MQKNKLVKTLFNTEPVREIGSEHALLLEAGNDFCCYVYWHKADNKIDGLKYLSFDETETERRLLEIINELQNKRVGNAVVCAAFSQALLVPNKFFKQDYSMLDAVYSQAGQTYFHDAIPEWQLVNAYSVPAGFNQAVQSAFTSVQFLHAYTPTIKIYNGYIADNQLLVHFTTQHFRVLLKKDSAVHLAQTYAYKTPLDVVYYLLKVCYEFGMAQQNVYLILSGLIEKDSNLVTELQQYFINLHFANPPEISLSDDTYPHHFFTSLFNLAACVS
ncbi:hypothetical protein GCM10023229_10170 [Flavisolibacter ginsenosidimutans]